MANETEEGGDEREKLRNDLDLLTGNPLPDDVLLYAVPVCGPYNAVQSYKYRVKLTPGAAKKGKGTSCLLSLISNEGLLIQNYRNCNDDYFVVLDLNQFS
jgi:NFACT protein C-terminal domain